MLYLGTLDNKNNGRIMFLNIDSSSAIDGEKYNSHILQEIIFVTRLVTILGIVMFMGFSVADYWAFSSSHNLLLVVRAIVSIVLTITLISTYSDFFKKHVLYILPIPYLVASAGINYMIYLAIPTDYAAQVYFVGLMLVIMMLFAWSFLQLRTTLFVSTFILFLYAYIVISKEGAGGEVFSRLLINLLFLVSSAIIGFFSQVIRDRSLKENYLLQQSLKKAYEQKNIESKNNAYLANHDPLTGLPNRRFITSLLEESLEEAKQKDKILSILFLDLNGFKLVNDIYGHFVGDEVLKTIAKRLELAIREGDRLSRLAGDEFIVGLLMDKDRLSEVDTMMKKFTKVISKPMNIDGSRIEIGVSIGLAAYPLHGNNIDILINIADKKMYKTKKGLQNSTFDYQQETFENESVVIFPGNSKSR